MPYPLLTNVVWHSLAGPHARYSSGTAAARRYARGFPPIIGFANTEQPDFSALAPYCGIGEVVYCGAWSGPVAPGWRIDVDAVAHQMIWEVGAPADGDVRPAIRLLPAHVPQMLELVATTHPGPFAERTVELGEYYGIFEGGRLAAMAGERFRAGDLREISGVCTHPDFQGRGFARQLVALLIRRELGRNEIPFLHVMQDNHQALRIYERMGFRRVQDCVVRIVSRTQ